MCTSALRVSVSAALLIVLVAASPSSDSSRTTKVGDTPTSRSLPQIENLRLDSAPPDAPHPAAVLKFDVLNDTSTRFTDVVMSVAFLQSPSADDPTLPARVVVGPVTVRVEEILEAGFALSYEMLFRNLSSDCDCLPRVEILSARSLPD